MARTDISKRQNKSSDAELSSVLATRTTHIGPLPAPETLEHYDRIVPGGAERIFQQFEKQSLHRQTMEAKVIASNTFVQTFGVVSASLIGIVAVGGGLFLVHEGKSVEGFAAFFTALASLVGVYVYGKQTQASERKRKDAAK